ncbi:MAG: DUF3572 domain-containing protein [Rhodobiaceae bacterium]|nr:DUF3572 domain-containing protein [Rhodobiaceae bacterium]MCC0057004.1 DUF3572 domain-containing protein [Rhodobiaceae bacterium]
MQEIEVIGIEILQFIAADEKHLTRFLSLTGLTPATLRQAAGSPRFHESLLAYLAQNERDLIEFAQSAGRKPEDIMRHAASLPDPDFSS